MDKFNSMLLTNPFTRKGMDYDSAQISAKEFIEYLYVPLSDSTDYTEDVEELQSRLFEFENIVMDTSKPLSGIVGSVGTGKTTCENLAFRELASGAG